MSSGLFKMLSTKCVHKLSIFGIYVETEFDIK